MIIFALAIVDVMTKEEKKILFFANFEDIAPKSGLNLEFRYVFELQRKFEIVQIKIAIFRIVNQMILATVDKRVDTIQKQ